MTNTLNKVTKQIKAKRTAKSGSDNIHPGSRDSRRINRAAMRDQRLQKQNSTKSKVKQAELSRVRFFQSAVTDQHIDVLPTSQVQQLIERYIHRDDEDREKLKKERRPGRPPSTREDILKHRLENELDEFRTGFSLPDLCDALNVAKLKSWDGTQNSLPLIKFVRVTKDG